MSHHSCPPRGWSGARVGVGTLRGVWDSLISYLRKFIGFLVFGFLVGAPNLSVPWCLDVLVSKILGFNVSRFLGFLVS